MRRIDRKRKRQEERPTSYGCAGESGAEEKLMKNKRSRAAEVTREPDASDAKKHKKKSKRAALAASCAEQEVATSAAEQEQELCVDALGRRRKSARRKSQAGTIA
eukprot:gnl/TRDRNA2_/TRDRNA2_138407_c2_seq4.p1 gnl/TRDRNA2_/TRDRNA2_138407_c2~~gnl/TRDRNA2_/TRDRNA2_138407_c2_seq4.p1  ORF type:complete len:105 (+),score=29.40 gnl/TRDRNA2_/TRDRNA2_138407_c2_seq4:100-414(+)